MLSLLSFAAVLAAPSLTLAASLEVQPRDVLTQTCSKPGVAFNYVGCYIDPSAVRPLAYDPKLPSDSMTIEKCTAACRSAGYRYAGLEYYFQCFCGASVTGPGLAADQSQCNYACTGDKSEVCGGFDLMSIYEDPNFSPIDDTTIADYQPQGCYTDNSGNGRALAFRQDQVSTATATIETCLKACKSGGYSHAGLEYYGECYCGVVLANSSMPVSTSECNTPCKGDSTEMCGGRSRLSLYVAQDLEAAPACPDDPPEVTMTSLPATTSSTAATTSSVSLSSSTSDVSSALTTSSNTSPSTLISTGTSTSVTSAAATTTDSSTSSSATSSTDSATSSSASASSSSIASTSSSTVASTSSSPVDSTSSTSISSSVSSASTASSISTTSSISQSSSTSSIASATTDSSTAAATSTLATRTTSTVSSMITTTTPSSTCAPNAPVPTAEYCCGRWCSKPLPWWSSSKTGPAQAFCQLQVASCFANAGWPAALQCFTFSNWCSKISSYSVKSTFISKCPPANPPPSYPSTICTPTTTTAAASTATSVVPPVATGVCVMPNGPRGSGYEGKNCVGDISPPLVTCNNIYADWRSNPFKLYENSDSRSCRSYSKGGVSDACQAACKVQYNSCVGTYAETCRSQRSGPSYNQAVASCKNQYYDCLDANNRVGSGGRCSSWNGGWN